jgi:hypothetical protein
MKISGSFLLLATGAAAFTQAPKPVAFYTGKDSSTAAFSSYLSDINNSNRFGNTDVRDVGRVRAPESGRTIRDIPIRRNDISAPLARREDDQVVRNIE